MRISLVFVCCLASVTCVAPGLAAQDHVPDARAIQWWQGAAVLGGIAAVSLVDQPLERYLQSHRSQGGDDLAAGARRMGQVEVFGSVVGGMAIAGIVAHRPALTRGALRVAASLALAGVIGTTGKMVLGRSRPNEERDADDFKPFSGHDAFPSGHTTMAFALATSLANEIRRPWASAGLLIVAAGTGWSRLNDNKHWLSDVVAGAAVGITSAQLIDARWRVFHVRPPILGAGPSGAALLWQVPF